MSPMTVRLGTHELHSPVVLAPMAGVTNVAFRRLCREQEMEKAGSTSGLYVCEMITARALVERNEKTLHMAAFSPDEEVRSLQLYTVDPGYTFKAAKMIAEENLADHLDINFGCPVPKVTKRGGGSAIPFKRRLFGAIVEAAVKGVEGTDIPVTVKFRLGLDDEHITYLETGRIAEENGASAMTLHARTAAERYSGHAHWDAIKALKEEVGIPVFGNGDIFSAHDGLEMLARTGCDGIEVGRGCLGRPWLFSDLALALRGHDVPAPPTLGEVTRILRRHAELLSEHMGEQSACRDIRKHIGWYFKGYPVGGEFRRQLSGVVTLAHLDDLLAPWADSDERPIDADGPRGRQGGAKPVSLPDGWLDDPDSLDIPWAEV